VAEAQGIEGAGVPKAFVIQWISTKYEQPIALSTQMVDEADIGNNSEGKVTKEEFLAYHKYQDVER
jgi:hypothetical protein